jgi:hypothetical protein
MILEVSGMVSGVSEMVLGIYGRFWKDRKGPEVSRTTRAVLGNLEGFIIGVSMLP